MGDSGPTYLGLDLSTQQLKAIVVDDQLKVLDEAYVQFDNDLPEFRTYGGVINKKESASVAVAPCLMWVKALDMLLDKLRVCGVDFARVQGISGCAQQHGTVYWSKGSRELLRNLSPDKFLHQQLCNAFATNYSPIWMDSSTSAECEILEQTVGGPQNLAQITGSKAYERFSGPQIAKIWRTRPDAYANTERISLISSFVASLLVGDYAPIDYSDGSGMNLLDIRTKDWNDQLLEASGPDLRGKLGETVPSYTNLASISSYYVERFGFSDQYDPKTLPEGHVLCNPLDKDAYMTMLCFKNGSFTRERIRDSAAGGSWQIFNELLDSTPRGNFGNIALYFDAPEIIPALVGDHRFNKADDKISRYSSKEVEVRALIEGQFIAKRAYAEDFGFVIASNSRIIATGGASANKTMLQVLADVFNAPVYTTEVANSAVLGAAYLAKYALHRDKNNFQEITKYIPEPQLLCTPYSDAESIYKPMVARYRRIVAQLLKQNASS
ncbi:Similar to XYLB: Xylulose kinase (Homo sapiens) [Cotesia congregata]|uniref:Xylulose kinase n=1 Tax=Cotesia congregata TaxID=51543 RepID=A0A8J2HS68_COTCN|nr:Similar to XYLB: Xylulose kinase (Homo sapiens) [Cotesia congregata]